MWMDRRQEGKKDRWREVRESMEGRKEDGKYMDRKMEEWIVG